MKRLATMTLAFAASLAVPISYADDIYCKVTGTFQGLIEGGSVVRGFEGWLPVMSLAGGVSRPFDLPSGEPSGVRQHQPLTIIHPLDRATPKLFKAAVTNELLTSVQCSFVNPLVRRGGRQYFQIILENARIVDMALAANAGSGAMAGGTIKFVYDRITLLDTLNNVSAVDDWQPTVD